MRLSRSVYPAALLAVASLAGDVAIIEEIIVKVNGDIILRSEYETNSGAEHSGDSCRPRAVGHRP